MAETYRTSEEYIFKAEFDEDRGLMFFPTGESVVRCKDCKYLCSEACEIWEVDNNDFCSRGERKDEVEE